MDNLAKRYPNPITPHADWQTCPICQRLAPRLNNPTPDDGGVIVGACFLCWYDRVLDNPDYTPIDGNVDTEDMSTSRRDFEARIYRQSDAEDITPITGSAEGDALMYGEDADSPEVEYIPFEDDGGEWDS